MTSIIATAGGPWHPEKRKETIMTHIDIMPNQLIFKRAFFGKELQEWIEILGETFNYDNLPMDEYSRIHCWNDNQDFLLRPVYGEEDDNGNFPVLGYNKE